MSLLSRRVHTTTVLLRLYMNMWVLLSIEFSKLGVGHAILFYLKINEYNFYTLRKTRLLKVVVGELVAAPCFLVPPICPTKTTSPILR